MNSDLEIRQDLRLELDQEEPPNRKKKSLWQKIKEFFTQEPEGGSSENWRNRNPSDW